MRNFWFVLAISSLPRLALAAAPKKEAAKAGPAAMTVPATAPPIAESVAFLNAWLAANPSPDRPCRSLSAVELSPNGELVVTITRQSYCEDTKIVVPLEALDARSVVATAGDTAMLRATCDQSVACARVWVKRKVRTGAGWVVRDADWISWGLPQQPHQAAAFEIPVGGSAQTVDLLRGALQYLIVEADTAPEMRPPVNPFAVAVNQKLAPPAPVETAEGAEEPVAEP